MGRRNKSSLLDDLMDIAAHLPWYVDVTIALIAYLIFHYFAVQQPLPTNPVELKAMGKTIGDLAVSTMIKTFSSIFQYLVPFALLIGAAISFYRRSKHKALHSRVASDSSHDALNKMSWQEFENLVAETFRQKGYSVMERGGNQADGGIDLIVKLGNDKYLVQCKQWKAYQVGVATVRELYGVMAAEGAVGCFVVTSGDFTPDAKAFASGRSIELVDAKQLRKMVGGNPPQERLISFEENPVCPLCASEMIQRLAKTGKNAGNKFWGCSRFPQCRGVSN